MDLSHLSPSVSVAVLHPPPCLLDITVTHYVIALPLHFSHSVHPLFLTMLTKMKESWMISV